MREYLFKTLQSLKLLTGLNQYEKIAESSNAEEQICLLLDELESTCKKFGYISDEKKKQIISKEILHDETMTALTPRKVYSWLAKYWTSLTPAEVAKITNKEEKDKDWEPLSPEDAQEYIDKWKEIHSKIENRHPTKRSDRQQAFKVSVSDGRRQSAIRQEVIDCPKCNNEEKEKQICPFCMGYGKIKRTII